MRTLIISGIFIVFYFLVTNIVASVLIEREIQEIKEPEVGDINVGDKVDVFVKRTRWYGTISESGNRANLKLFKIVNIPIKVNGSSWAVYHFIALALLIFLVIKLNKEKEKCESNLDGEYSSYS